MASEGSMERRFIFHLRSLPHDVLAVSDLRFSRTARVLIAMMKGGECNEWQDLLRESLEALNNTHTAQDLVQAVLTVLQAGPVLKGCVISGTQGVMAVGASYAGRRLHIGVLPHRSDPRAAAAARKKKVRRTGPTGSPGGTRSTREPPGLVYALGSMQPEHRSSATAEDDAVSRMRQLVMELDGEQYAQEMPVERAPDWIAAVRAMQAAMVKSRVWCHAGDYCTQQPARAAAFALGKPCAGSWKDVYVHELRAATPDRNGLFDAAMRELGADCTVLEMKAALESWLARTRDESGAGLADDPRLWSCAFCKSGLGESYAVRLFQWHSRECRKAPTYTDAQEEGHERGASVGSRSSSESGSNGAMRQQTQHQQQLLRLVSQNDELLAERAQGLEALWRERVQEQAQLQQQKEQEMEVLWKERVLAAERLWKERVLAAERAQQGLLDLYQQNQKELSNRAESHIEGLRWQE